jgi:hypothetical protein
MVNSAQAQRVRLITHAGEAHRDDLLATALLLAAYPGHIIEVLRVRSMPADLAPEDFVVDIGGCAGGRRLDHHQLPAAPPRCSISLVLQLFGLYEQARQFWPWLEFAERMDVLGPTKTAAWLGLSYGPEALAKVVSPVEQVLLRAFSRVERMTPTDWLWQALEQVGAGLLEDLRLKAARLRWLQQHAVIYREQEQPLGILVLDQDLRQEPQLALNEFRAQFAPGAAFAVVPDSRSDGWAIYRFAEDPRFDFSRCAKHPAVAYAHTGGFLLKTHPLTRAQLDPLNGTLAELLALARVPSPAATGADTTAVSPASVHQ